METRRNSTLLSEHFVWFCHGLKKKKERKSLIVRDDKLPRHLGSKDGAVVRALASHQRGLGSIPGLCVVRGLSLLLVLVLAPRVFLRVLRFSSLHKNQHFQIPIRPGNSGEKSHSVDSTEIPI